MRQLSRAVVPGILAMLFSDASLHAADVNVLASTALQPVFMKLAPEFERTTGDRLFFFLGRLVWSQRRCAPHTPWKWAGR